VPTIIWSALQSQFAEPTQTSTDAGASTRRPSPLWLTADR
jgi:hypothetical protein